ncbi:MAG: GTP-binding protein [Alphaproteobacteria bacterium]|nr:GTP-binding protein [Alphaproteobacteria bacterium]
MTRFAPNIRFPLMSLSVCFRAGKTTLLKHVLTNSESWHIAATFKGMSEVKIDAMLVGETRSLSYTEGQQLEMSNACFCCTPHKHLMQGVAEPAHHGRFADPFPRRSTEAPCRIVATSGRSAATPVAPSICP